MSAPVVSNLLEVSGQNSSAKRSIATEDISQGTTASKLVEIPTITRACGVSPWALSRTRRSIDFFVAFLALLIFAPLMFTLAVAVQVESDGSAIFMQERMGRNGEVFTLYKFRSMRSASHPGSPITVSGDNRVTRVGALLRKFKLDELPQFLNVLKGEMSLVGPRPKLPHHEGLRMPFRPGVTGAATLAFRFEEEMLKRIPPDQLDRFYDLVVKPKKAKIDWEYMQTATFRTDLAVIWKTAKACISKDEGTEAFYDEFLPQLSQLMEKRPAPVVMHPKPLPANGDPPRVHPSAHTAPGFMFVSEQIES